VVDPDEFVLLACSRSDIFERTGCKDLAIPDCEGFDPGVVIGPGPNLSGIYGGVFRHNCSFTLWPGCTHMHEVSVFAKTDTSTLVACEGIGKVVRLERSDLRQGDLLEAFHTKLQAHTGF